MNLLKRMGGNTSTPRSKGRQSVSVSRLSRKGSIDLDDPTVCSEDVSELGCFSKGPTKKQYRIQFREDRNQVYESDSNDEYDSTITWFQKEELQEFYNNTCEEGHLYATRERGNLDSSWSKNLLKAYQAFCRVESAHDMDLIFGAMANPAPVDASLVGMETFAIPQIKAVRGQRREKLFTQVRRIQAGNDDMKKSERNRRIRKLSHEASRPSRLFAMHLAQLVQA